MEAPIKILRDCDATLIPSGDEIKLIKGTLIRITQALGGDFTLYVNGNLVKLSGKDADAIGETMDDGIEKSMDINNGEYSEELVWEQLRTCFDPEIPVNIVDLGLIYDLSKKGNKKNGYSLNIKMTLTAPGCGMGPSIAQDVDNKVNALPGVNEVLVEVVWDPVWDQSMMSEDAKLKLGMF
jgi:probable FeS assembly SUF system protein SufT